LLIIHMIHLEFVQILHALECRLIQSNNNQEKNKSRRQ
jgi:hypothetical protein